MDEITQKRRLRGQKLDEMRALLDKCEREGRNFNAAEERRWTALSREVDDLAAEIGGLLQLRNGHSFSEVMADSNRPLGRIAPPWPLTDGQYSGPLRPGEVRFLGLRDRLADHVPETTPQGIPREELSLGRFVRAHVTGDWSRAEAERRVALGSLDTGGGYLVPDALSANVLDLARANTVVLKAGAATIPMATSSLAIARLTGDPTAYWRSEGVEITESDATFGAIVLRAKTLACLTRLSVELVEDADNAAEVIEHAMAQSIALALDRAAIRGSGGGEEPTGLYHDADVNELDLGTDGDVIEYGDVSEAIQDIEEANGSPNAFIAHPRDLGYLDRLVDGVSQPLQPLPSFTRLEKLTTTAIPTDLEHGAASNASFALVGHFPALGIGLRTQLQLEVFRGDSESVKKLQVALRAYLRADVAILRPTWFTRIVGIIPGS